MQAHLLHLLGSHQVPSPQGALQSSSIRYQTTVVAHPSCYAIWQWVLLHVLKSIVIAAYWQDIDLLFC